MFLRSTDVLWPAPADVGAATAPVYVGDTPPDASSRDGRRADDPAAPTEEPSSVPSRLPVVTLRGIGVHAVTEAQCVEHVIAELGAGRGGVVVTPNLDHLRRCASDTSFSDLVAAADLVVADGMPLVWASRLQGTPLPQRVAGSDLIWSLSAAAARQDRSVFLLGGDPGTAEGAARVLGEQCPGLTIAGAHCPPPGFEDDDRHTAAVADALRAAGPDIVFVALGSPKQENLIARLRPLLPGAWWLGVGISFSFVCGDVRRAPVWMRRCGLEWAHRFAQEPRRLFRRYVVSGPPFAVRLLGGAALRGVPNRIRARVDAGRRKSAGSLPVADVTATPPTAAPEFGHSEGVTILGGPAVCTSIRAALRTARTTGRLPVMRSFPETPAARSGTNADSAGLRLRAVVLLGGAVRPTPLGLAAGRSVLDLPLDGNGNTSVLGRWLDEAARVAGMAGAGGRLPVRVMLNPAAAEPTGRGADPRHAGSFRVERDSSEYRGTGGVLRDIANDYGDHDVLLVANAAQVLLEPLPSLAAALRAEGGDVTVVSHADGTPGGLMLVRCGSLRCIPASGFVDMKEQGLPRIAAAGFGARVLHRRRPTGLPLRTLQDYVLALRHRHDRRQAIGAAAADPLDEDWAPAFSIIEPGADVGPSARVHDSVVLAGGVVEDGAVLVRSVVCPGGVVRRDKAAVDQFVTAAGAARGRRLSGLLAAARG